MHHDILSAMSERKACLLVLLDLTSAFDTVDHAQVLGVLEDLGLSGIPLQWFDSYLKDRQQVVSISGSKSAPRELTSGVPQGSVLGPVLFTLYTASLGRLIESFGFSYHFYADDTSVYITFERSDTAIAIERLQQCISSVRNHLSQKKLKMNATKTELVVIASKTMSRRMEDVPAIVIGDDLVSVSNAVKYIGVEMDKHLSMDAYINSICKTCHYHLYKIGRIRHLLNRRACEQLIHAFISSKLDYANAILCHLPKRLTGKLQKIQNTAARIVTGVRRREHITPILRELHWLPVAQRIEFKLCLLVYKCVHGMAPEYLKELIKPPENRRDLRSTTLNRLHVPISNGSLSHRTFGIMGPMLWNELDVELKNTCDFNSFKRKLKTFFFTKAFY